MRDLLEQVAKAHAQAARQGNQRGEGDVHPAPLDCLQVLPIDVRGCCDALLREVGLPAEIPDPSAKSARGLVKVRGITDRRAPLALRREAAAGHEG